jgi:hypothetical protein
VSQHFGLSDQSLDDFNRMKILIHWTELSVEWFSTWESGKILD